MKKFNLAALPLAVAGVLASTSAFAGTEACFEVYRVAAGAVVTSHGTLYTPASCNYAGTDVITVPATPNNADLVDIDNARVAWELTGDLQLDLEALGAAAGTPRHHIVYIPTTDIPPASRIEMTLSGNVDFGTANANQIYLVHKDSAGNYQTVASSDGAFDNTDTVEFLTKAGVTIGAGSRLLLSQTNPSGVAESGALIEGIAIHIDNSESCTIEPLVTIAATKAETDSGTTIQGGSTKVNALGKLEAVSILDISEQFAILSISPTAPNATRNIEVDAEDPSFRKSFVNNGMAGTPATWSNQVIAQKAFWEAEFTNKFDTLDMFVTLDAADTVTVAVSADSGTGDGVTFGVLTANAIADAADVSILDATKADHLSVAPSAITLVDFNGVAIDEVPLTSTPTNYVAFADEYFSESTGVVSTVNAAATLTNDATEVMEFNYNVDTSWSMTFVDSTYLNKVSCQTPSPFAVGVNGAVLKVPYVYTKANEGGFVRITSEHTTEATIFLDIFDESSNETKNVNLGKIAPKASNVLKADDMLAAAIADGYVGTGDRHTMTFTVTAPKNKVHGVSVQKIAGGVDRVMPVLDQNDWSQ